MIKSNLKALTILVITISIYAVIIINKIYSPTTYAVLLVLIGYSIVESSRRKLISANVFFLIYFLYTVGLGPFFLMLGGIDMDFDPFIVVLGGLLAFALGSYSKDAPKNIKIVHDKAYIQMGIPRIYMLRFLFVVSLIAALFFYISNRALLSGNLNENRVEAQSGSGLLLTIAQLPILLVPMMYNIYLLEKDQKKKQITNKELLFCTILSSITLLVSGFRGPVLVMYICLIIPYIRINKVKTSRLLIIGIVFILMVEFLGNLRKSMSGEDVESSVLLSIGNSLVVNSLNLSYVFSAFPLKIPFQFGYTYLINILMLKPGPDLDFTMWLKETLGMSFSGGGVTPTVIGEFYLNFGYIGIYGGMFLLAKVGHWVNLYLVRHSFSFLGVYYLWQFAHCASGGIANVTVPVTLYTIIYWGIMLFPSKVSNVSLRSNG